MTDDLVKRLRCEEHWPLDWGEAVEWCREAADRIEKLEEENSVLFAANVRLNSRADLDCDHYRDRIKKLEAALRSVIDWDNTIEFENGLSWGDVMDIARKALEWKDDR